MGLTARNGLSCVVSIIDATDFSYVRPESRIPAQHPLRLIRHVADEALAALDGQFAPSFDPARSFP